MHVLLTCYPLHPDDIISFWRWDKFLQIVKVVGFHPVCIISKVTFMSVKDEVFHHVEHLHGFKHRKQNPFRHSSNSTATV